jgi:2'-hydroxyisoflavone reductase
MMSSFPRTLVLGGTAFIGRTFCEIVRVRHGASATLLNRGVTNPGLFPDLPLLRCDRNSEADCKRVLDSTHWECVVDFTAQQDHHIRNVLRYIRCDHYTLVSSSVVDLSWPTDPLFPMAQNKLWCEHLVQKYVKNVLIVRPGFVCGPNDYTSRFEQLNGQWFWKGTSKLVTPMVCADFLANLMIRLVREKRTGITRAGYMT